MGLTVFKANVAKNINEANAELDLVAKLFVPKVPCATISARFLKVSYLLLIATEEPAKTNIFLH